MISSIKSARTLRLAGLMAVVAMLVIAAFGSASALATEDNEDVLEPVSTNVVATVDANKSVWNAKGSIVSCKKSSAGVTTPASGSNTLPLTLTANNPALTY